MVEIYRLEIMNIKNKYNGKADLETHCVVAVWEVKKRLLQGGITL